jgi:hypothetical protein
MKVYFHSSQEEVAKKEQVQSQVKQITVQKRTLAPTEKLRDPPSILDIVQARL